MSPINAYVRLFVRKFHAMNIPPFGFPDDGGSGDADGSDLLTEEEASEPYEGFDPDNKPAVSAGGN